MARKRSRKQERRMDQPNNARPGCGCGQPPRCAVCDLYGYQGSFDTHVLKSFFVDKTVTDRRRCMPKWLAVQGLLSREVETFVHFVHPQQVLTRIVSFDSSLAPIGPCRCER